MPLIVVVRVRINGFPAGGSEGRGSEQDARADHVDQHSIFMRDSAIRGNEWVAGIAQGLNVVKVSVASVPVEHQVRMQDFTNWLERKGGSPREMADRERGPVDLGLWCILKLIDVAQRTLCQANMPGTL